MKDDGSIFRFYRLTSTWQLIYGNYCRSCKSVPSPRYFPVFLRYTMTNWFDDFLCSIASSTGFPSFFTQKIPSRTSVAGASRDDFSSRNKNAISSYLYSFSFRFNFFFHFHRPRRRAGISGIVRPFTYYYKDGIPGV